eukprot:CAMPEP_0184320594 /NCGR_PEP_ID=MMETSP1049-20130417/114653_1 /TAXON_ID=77928 /ORGANISM="Proteomonas sulcata, Strain CCMP704" /LENGTH=418 /DNA_ID=CAMNT_0026641141 /DNA_START=166 /DNA_END=1422 /DNA_ORIENTATION=+
MFEPIAQQQAKHFEGLGLLPGAGPRMRSGHEELMLENQTLNQTSFRLFNKQALGIYGPNCPFPVDETMFRAREAQEVGMMYSVMQQQQQQQPQSAHEPVSHPRRARKASSMAATQAREVNSGMSKASQMPSSREAGPPWHRGKQLTAKVFPRRKAGQSVRSTDKPIIVTRDMLVPYFGMPLRHAADHLGLCPTALKSVCRRLQIIRWPFKQCRRSPSASSGSTGSSEAVSETSSSTESTSPSEGSYQSSEVASQQTTPTVRREQKTMPCDGDEEDEDDDDEVGEEQQEVTSRRNHVPSSAVPIPDILPAAATPTTRASMKTEATVPPTNVTSMQFVHPYPVRPHIADEPKAGGAAYGHQQTETSQAPAAVDVKEESADTSAAWDPFHNQQSSLFSTLENHTWDTEESLCDMGYLAFAL